MTSTSGIRSRTASAAISVCATATFLLATALASAASAQAAQGTVWIPDSSIEKPHEAGRREHTNIRVLLPIGESKFVPPSRRELATGGPPVGGLFFETPASLTCIYHLARSQPAACNPNVATRNPSGGGGAIAIVDAFDDPTAANDIAVFSSQFGLATANFTTVFASGTRPATDPTGGWELEESLDLEWAHAMAPNAKIFLVEAASNSGTDLFNAVSVASQIVAQHGGGEVSMSWGGSEFSEETQLDQLFTTPGVVYVASAGDSPGVSYPAASPNVISAGGTSTNRDPFTGSFEREGAWQPAGGGPSAVEPRPSYQDAVQAIVGPTRGTPDLAFDSDPITGVWVFDSASGTPTWFVVGGTSVAAPSLSGIINAAGKFAASSAVELALLYQQLGVGREFRDINLGNCGPFGGFIVKTGWDFCTGIGSPLGLLGK